MANGFKTGGRKTGTPNKKTNSLMELIEKHHKGFDPVIELINLYKDPQTLVDLKITILKEISSYIYPKRKAIEADIKTDTIDPISRRIDQPIEELLKELYAN